MKYVIIFFVSIFLIITVVNIVQTGDKPIDLKDKTTTNTKTSRIYPIAPGVWYPGDGALPEKPVRYYRARCWPGCHSGSPQGKYPNRPLNMKPIFPTSTVPAQPTKLRDTK